MEDMKKIEAAQTELGRYLLEMIPVPWKKICLYAKAAPKFAQTWFGFIEKETDVVCARDFFWNRYDSYPIDKEDVTWKIPELVLAIYNAYLERFGKEKIWRLMFYTIDSDGKIHIDFEYKDLEGNSLDQHDAVYRRFFDAEYEYYWTKYPSTEIGHE